MSVFKIIKKDKNSQARIGKLETKSGGLSTPVFLPIATYGAVKNLSVEEIKQLGAPRVFESFIQDERIAWLSFGNDS